MNYNLNLGLKGEYKVDIYSGKKLVETTDWFSNDITNVGLNYPFDYSFARCFMFLSLGSGLNLPTNNRNETGLANPIYKFKVSTNVDPGDPSSEKKIIEHSGQYIGWNGYEYSVDKKDGVSVENVPSTCGTRITERGIRFYRGWTIPTGNSDLGNTLAETLPITQFMVSPSSGLDPKGAGKAFSIVNRPVTIPSGFSATITYQLSIDFENYKTPFTFFSGKSGQNSNGFFDTGDAILSVNGSDETELVRSWSNLSGIFRQIVPGIEAVDAMGACFSPSNMGSELEPSYINCYNTFFYFSPDISQFAISKSGTYGGEYSSYNSNGLMLNYYEKASIDNVSTELHSNREDASEAYTNPTDWFYYGGSVRSAGSNPLTEITMFNNPRLVNFIDISNYKTGKITSDILNYKTTLYTGAKNFPVAFATPGKIGFNNSFPDFGQKFVRSSYLKRVPISEELRSTGTRFKYVTKKAIIPPLYSYGTNSRYGTLTLAYNKSKENQINNLLLTPLIDFLFFDSEGRGANMAHYRYIPNIYLKDRGTGVAKIRFDIVGLDEQKPDSINRFYSVYGFMGTGIDNPLTSGLDIGPIGSEEGHFFSNTSLGFTSEDQAKLTPPGPKSIGFLLDGQILNSNVPGSIVYNNNTGYGAVYGVIANSGFYFSPYDLCLLDIPNWSGLGGYPYSTGYTGNLCWPHYSKKIYLKLSELEYYDPEIQSEHINDPLNYFANKQIIKDILISGSGTANPVIYESMVTGGISSEIYLCHLNGKRITATNNTYPIFTGIFIITGQNFNNDLKYNQISFTPLKKQIGATYAFVFTGFSDNFSLLERGYGSGLNFPIQLSGITGTIQTSASTIFNTGFTLSNDDSNFIKNKDYVFVPSNLKKPEAYIYHVETTGNDIGYRILPNYAIANTGNINKYLPVTGGTFPGLSIENGMELYLTLSWTGA